MQKKFLKNAINLYSIHNLGGFMSNIDKKIEAIFSLFNEKEQSIVAYFVFNFLNNSRKSSTASLSAGSREAHIFMKSKSTSL